MSKLFKVVAVGFASMALAFGASACGGSKTTTDTVTKTDQAVTTTDTVPATTTNGPADPNGVPPVTPAQGGKPATCPSADPEYDAATGLCYPKGAKRPE